MTIVINLIIVIASIVCMEILAALTHKYIMHGWGWGWHESHHVKTEGVFEKNDLYAVVFSVIAAGLFILGSLYSPVIWYIALGITIYGALYGFVHDGLVHQRWPFFMKAPGGYMKRLVQAHRIHHAVETKDGAVSFGFLYAENIRVLKARLKSKQNP